MIGLLTVMLTALAGWLWIPPDDPARRVHRIHRAGPAPGPPGFRAGGSGGPGIPERSARLGRSKRPGSPGTPQAGAEALPFRPPEANGVPAARRRLGRKETMLCAAVGVTVFLLVEDAPGLAAGALGAVVTWAMLRRREPPGPRREHDRVAADLPLAADLMVACLRAGQPSPGPSTSRPRRSAGRSRTGWPGWAGS